MEGRKGKKREESPHLPPPSLARGGGAICTYISEICLLLPLLLFPPRCGLFPPKGKYETGGEEGTCILIYFHERDSREEKGGKKGNACRFKLVSSSFVPPLDFFFVGAQICGKSSVETKFREGGVGGSVAAITFAPVIPSSFALLFPLAPLIVAFCLPEIYRCL